MVLSHRLSLRISSKLTLQSGRKPTICIISISLSMVSTSSRDLVIGRGALENVSARYMCWPGLKPISRSYFCRQSNILCHEGFAVDNFKWFVVTLDGNFATICVLVKILCSKHWLAVLSLFGHSCAPYWSRIGMRMPLAGLFCNSVAPSPVSEGSH